MLSKVAGMMKAEMTRAASMFEAIQGRFLGVLEAYKEKLPGEVTEETAEAVDATTEAEPAAEAEPAEATEATTEAEPAAEPTTEAAEATTEAEPAAEPTTDEEPAAEPQEEPDGEPEREKE
jgi:hypothetical protein